MTTVRQARRCIISEYEDDWQPVDEFPGYSVNPLGEIRKDSTGCVLYTRINQFGAPYVGLMKDGRQRNRSLPKLVLSAFKPQPNEVFDTPINLDGDRTNCHVDNLQWRPRWFAVLYVQQFKERYGNPIRTPIRDIETDFEFPDSFTAACQFGLLERDVVLSILNNTLTWPTFQQFQIID